MRRGAERRRTRAPTRAATRREGRKGTLDFTGTTPDASQHGPRRREYKEADGGGSRPPRGWRMITAGHEPTWADSRLHTGTSPGLRVIVGSNPIPDTIVSAGKKLMQGGINTGNPRCYYPRVGESLEAGSCTRGAPVPRPRKSERLRQVGRHQRVRIPPAFSPRPTEVRDVERPSIGLRSASL